MKLGKLEKITDLRSIWKHEAKEFTPWLAKEENLELLSEAVGIDIVLEEQESNVGDFSVDLYASGAGSREGKIVLCKARDKSDRNVSSFTIKKYHSEKIANEDGWMHSKITLSPLNSNYNPIIISAEEAEEDEFKIYGEFICVN